MNNKKQGISFLIISILVLTIGLTYAYYSAQVQGTGNTNAETSATTATLGEVEFNGETTFDSSTLEEIYPGFIGVQTFTVGPAKNGSGIYEIDLASTVPDAFGSDIKITLYKTSDAENNNITREEGTLTINNNQYVKQDTLATTGSLTKVYEGVLSTTTQEILEQVEFNIASNVFVTPDTTPDGYYTYYAVYEYLDNGNQNEQQGLNFSSKITVRYILEVTDPARETLESLQALDNTLTVISSTATNPNFARLSPQSTPGVSYDADYRWDSLANGTDTYVTYASDFTYDDTTGQYTLTNYTTCQYSSCYNDLIGKYIIFNEDESYGSDTNTAIIQSYSSMGNEVDKVDTADAEGNLGVTVYTNSELNEVKQGTWQAQTSGLFELEDDYGTSYYFRGDVTNNYVKFGTWQTDWYNANDYGQFTTLAACEATAGNGNCGKYASAGDDMYWRIIRINGDGTIRMIYDGTSAHGTNNLEDGTTLFRSIGKSAYNTNSNDNAYVGYMYGTAGSDNYNDTHANINNSTIKTRLDSWYQSQMTSYASYIADAIFCNDRSIGSDEAIDYVTNKYSDTYGKLGYGTNTTLYGSESRLIEEIVLGKGNRATLKCPNKNDAFTVSDTMHGNGALDYPVGLITMDEANIAGGIGRINYDYYLTSGAWYWAFSPGEFYRSSNALVEYVGDDGYIFGWYYVRKSYGSLRPVINLKSGSLSKGSGTASNPYEVGP